MLLFQADSDLTEEEAMMQAIAMSLGVGEGGEEDETPPGNPANQSFIFQIIRKFGALIVAMLYLFSD